MVDFSNKNQNLIWMLCNLLCLS